MPQDNRTNWAAPDPAQRAAFKLNPRGELEPADIETNRRHSEMIRARELREARENLGREQRMAARRDRQLGFRTVATNDALEFWKAKEARLSDAGTTQRATASGGAKRSNATHSAACHKRGAWGQTLLVSPTPGCPGCRALR